MTESAHRIDTCVRCVRWGAGGNLLCSTGAQLSAPDDLHGWDSGGEEGEGKREVMYVCIELIHFIFQRKLIQHRKATIRQ